MQSTHLGAVPLPKALNPQLLTTNTDSIGFHAASKPAMAKHYSLHCISSTTIAITLMYTDQDRMYTMQLPCSFVICHESGTPHYNSARLIP